MHIHNLQPLSISVLSLSIINFLCPVNSAFALWSSSAGKLCVIGGTKEVFARSVFNFRRNFRFFYHLSRCRKGEFEEHTRGIVDKKLPETHPWYNVLAPL